MTSSRASRLGLVALLVASVTASASGCSAPEPTAPPVTVPPPPVIAPPVTAPPVADPGIAFEDSVHALVVFVRFADDDAPAPEWGVSGEAGRERLPAWGEGLIHPVPAAVGPQLSPDDPAL